MFKKFVTPIITLILVIILGISPVLAEIQAPEENISEEIVLNETVEEEQPEVESEESQSEIEPEVEEVAAEEEVAPTITASGQCSENINWELNSNYVLTITGIGDIPDYSFDDKYINDFENNLAPWFNYTSNIVEVNIVEGITSIGRMSFAEATNLTAVNLPGSLLSINEYAFYECTSLSNIVFPERLNSIGRYAFYGCSLLNNDLITCGIDNIGSCAFEFEGDSQVSWDKSRNMVNSVYDYLNYMYIETCPEAAFEYDYMSLSDKDILVRLAEEVTKECSTNLEKVNAVYDWVETNIDSTYSRDMGYLPLEVVRLLNADCVGTAQITSTLLKFSGVPAIVCRGQKENSTVCKLEITYKQTHGHEWVMAYYNDDWYLLDTLWNNNTNNKDYIAEQYYFEQVDGVTPYNEISADIMKGIYKRFCYEFKDGVFSNKCYGEKAQSSGAISVGGGIRYISYTHTTPDKAYYTKIDENGFSFDNIEIGNRWPAGLYLKLNNKDEARYVKVNGTKIVNAVQEFDGRIWYTKDGISKCLTDTVLPESLAYRTIYRTYFVIFDGESISECFNLPDDYVNIKDRITFNIRNTDILEISEDGKIIVKNEGSTNIFYYLDGQYMSSFDFYFAKELPTNKFVTGEFEEEEIIVEDELVEEVEELEVTEPGIEEPIIIEEPAIEEPAVEEQEEIVEEPIEPVVEGEPVEQVVEEEPETFEEIIKDIIEEVAEVISEVIEKISNLLEDKSQVEESIKDVEVVEESINTIPVNIIEKVDSSNEETNTPLINNNELENNQEIIKEIVIEDKKSEAGEIKSQDSVIGKVETVDTKTTLETIFNNVVEVVKQVITTIVKAIKNFFR